MIYPMRKKAFLYFALIGAGGYYRKRVIRESDNPQHLMSARDIGVFKIVRYAKKYHVRFFCGIAREIKLFPAVTDIGKLRIDKKTASHLRL